MDFEISVCINFIKMPTLLENFNFLKQLFLNMFT